MKTIKIKRATVYGLLECEGILVEKYGLQFCFTKIDNSIWYLIELSTGSSVERIFDVNYTEAEALEIALTKLNQRTEAEIKKAFPKFKRDSKRLYRIPFPVNEAVSPCR